MKNLFKSKIKWQHRSSDPASSSQPQPSSTSPASSPSGTAPAPALSSAAPAPTASSPSPSAPAATPTAPVGGRGGGGAGGDDYMYSEEEFQMQLAMALSASNSDCAGDRDRDQIRDAKLMSLGGGDRFAAARDDGHTADSLSRRYWDYNVLDYNEKVVDGFYDIFDPSMESSRQGKMPSLEDLQTGIGDLGFEVIVINRAVDTALQEMEQVAQCILLDFPVANITLLVQRIADLVTDNLGGPVKDANAMLARWLETSTQLRTSLHTSLLPIGCIKLGLSRHRALLFKILADSVGVPCKLVKGSNYTGDEDDAVNIIKVDKEREFLVDLMAAPGALIPADVLSWKGSSSNSNHKLGQRPAQNQMAGSSSTIYPTLGANALPLEHKGDQLPLLNSGDWISGSQSGYEKEAAITHSQTSSSGTPSVTAADVFDGSWTLVSRAQSDEPSTSAGTSSQHKVVPPGGEHPGAGNIKLSPGHQENTESNNLFAELNPFGRIESKKASVPFNGPDNRNNELQRRRENVVPSTGRPQQRLVMKNWSPYNDVSNNKQYNYVQDSFARRNVGDNVVSSPQVPRSAANNTNLNIGARNDGSHAAAAHNNDSFMAGSSAMKMPSVAEIGKAAEIAMRGDLSKGPTGSRLEDQPPFGRHKWGDSAERRIPTNSVQNQAKEREANFDGKQDHKKLPPDPKKSPHDRFMDVSMPSRNPESISPSSARSHRLDCVFDDVSECEILWEDLVIGERIGLGSYGEVYRADWNGTEVAVKKFLDQDFYGDALDEFRSEVRIMRRLRHPNIVLFMGAVTRPPNLSIVSEYLPRGSLYKILHRPGCQIDEKRRIKMAIDVAKGMNCLHTSVPTIVHRDLKSPNLLVDNNWNVKVCDFGLSRLKHSTFLSSKSTAGTPEWMAPEVLRNEQSNEKCDVYSFGVILWELATLRMPWGGMNPMQVVGAVGFQDRRLDIPKEIDPLVARIIWECWQKDPNLRPSFAQLTTALKTVQRLVSPSPAETQSPPVPQEIWVNSSTP
ncbi:Serine/threonine-protein kinase CTR1 [Hordeum vulgare]|uniref:non-specific serine/threonine protein kinase n=1 Tax=Hordeum vulgare subsp. vulgare TaxID=112509 RepID=A0A8I6XHM9_HORVV|nr:serine/threonine-protein kinase EDR1 [Hordeum vulgare subsp. vulgare]KAE8816658.1 Serine/threonine-protein kinase CTR1 [Hordeum vulgare]